MARTQKQGNLKGTILRTIPLLALPLMLWHYTRPSNFPLKKVKIFATYEHVNHQLLQATIANHLNQGFFRINVFTIKQHLLRIPWIYDVSIKKRWPDTIIIHVAEQTAAMRWGTEALVNIHGKIFTTDRKHLAANLPVIFGPADHAQEIFNACKKIITLLEPLDLTVKKLTLTPHRHWEILLNNNTIVYLGETEPMKQIESLVNLYRKITANHSGEPKSIDLRYRNGLAVRW